MLQMSFCIEGEGIAAVEKEVRYKLGLLGCLMDLMERVLFKEKEKC